MILSVQNLCVRFQGRTLFENLNLDVDKGDHLVVHARALDGSTTLLKCCAGVMTESASGKVLFDGVDLLIRPRPKHFDHTLGHIGLVHEDDGLLESFNVFDNLRLPLQYHALCKAAEMDDRIKEIARDLDIRTLLHQETDELHWVHTRLVNLARALVIRPRLLLIDKLEIGLTKDIVVAALAVVKRYQERDGIGVVRTTMSHAEWATRTYRIVNCNIVQEPIL